MEENRRKVGNVFGSSLKGFYIVCILLHLRILILLHHTMHNQHLFRVTWIVASSHVRSSSILKCLLHFLSCFHRCDVLHLIEKGAYISNLLWWTFCWHEHKVVNLIISQWSSMAGFHYIYFQHRLWFAYKIVNETFGGDFYTLQIHK